MMAPMVALLIVIMASSLIQSVASTLYLEKESWHQEKDQKADLLPLLGLSLMMKVLGKGVTRAGKGYNNMDHLTKRF